MERDSVQNIKIEHSKRKGVSSFVLSNDCLLYTSDAADE
mgnify:CR=1 FL=1